MMAEGCFILFILFRKKQKKTKRIVHIKDSTKAITTQHTSTQHAHIILGYLLAATQSQ
jgi:hypothetical protein